MLDDMSLHNKLNMLQAEMLKFHKEISPKKDKAAEGMLPSEESTFLSTCYSLAFSFLKILVCIVGPTLFPAIIYCIEGSSRLFWQVTAISCIITLLLAIMTATLLWINMKKVKDRIKEMLIAFSSIFNNTGFFRFAWEVLTSDFIKMNSHKIIYPVFILFISSFVSYITYTKKLWTAFYTSLVVNGFIFGILTTVIYELLNSPELLPFHSPYKVKMVFTTPSSKAKKELEFKPNKEPDSTPVSRFSTLNLLLPNRNSQFTDAQDKAAVLPNYSASINHGERGNAAYQLPINFSKFFRILQS